MKIVVAAIQMPSDWFDVSVNLDRADALFALSTRSICRVGGFAGAL